MLALGRFFSVGCDSAGRFDETALHFWRLLWRWPLLRPIRRRGLAFGIVVPVCSLVIGGGGQLDGRQRKQRAAFGCPALDVLYFSLLITVPSFSLALPYTPRPSSYIPLYSFTGLDACGAGSVFWFICCYAALRVLCCCSLLAAAAVPPLAEHT